MIKYRLSWPLNTAEFLTESAAVIYRDALIAAEEARAAFANESPAVVEYQIDPIEYEPPAPPAPEVPQQVTPLQMRRALNAAGLRATVEAAVAAAPQDARDAWEFATVVLRSDPLLTGMATELGMSTAQVDGLFIAAAQYA